MTREVAKICEERAPWDKSSHFRIYAVLYSNTFRIIDDISSVLFLFVCFFFARVSFITEATQYPGYIYLRKS